MAYHLHEAIQYLERSMRETMRKRQGKMKRPLLLGLAVGVMACAGSSPWWWESASQWGQATLANAMKSQSDAHDDHEGHDHGDHPEDANSIELSSQALKNLGLDAQYLKTISLSSYRKTISVPAIVASRPGRTQLRVSSPLSGVVTHVHAVTGETVTSGHLLFEVRLTYEDLVETQTQFLKSLSELEVESREIQRLEEVTRSGAVSEKILLDRRYAREKIEAFLASQREALRLHGLTADQVATIERERKLLRDLEITAPDIDSHDHEEELRLSRASIQPVTFRLAHASHESHARPLILEDLRVQKGQGITAGEMLCTLSDYSQLYIEGQAFEQDGPLIANALEKGWNVEANFASASGQESVPDLKIAYLKNSVDESSRTLSFYVKLENKILRDESNAEDQRFLTWKYRVGQRLQLQVPVEVWENQFVLPVDAVVKEGAEWFVFRRKGKKLERIPVHVRHRDPQQVVIENDGALVEGNTIALRSAHQIQMAIKNKSGAPVDAHGHSH